MPKGTVFCKFPLSHQGDGKNYIWGIGSPSILVDTYGNDFYPVNLGSDLMPIDADFNLRLDTLCRNLGEESRFEHCSGRDGLFEDENVGFAIYSREEVQEMIELLQEALRDGYTETKEGEKQ
jgi:hypothetical protein